MEEFYFVYCAVDQLRTTIKIGVTLRPDNREIDLSRDGKLNMRIVCMLKLTPKHSDYTGILGDNDNYHSDPNYKRNNLFFGVDVKRSAHKIETFFKRKFSYCAMVGTKEWFPYSEYTISYIENMLMKFKESESTALIRTDFIKK